MRFPLPLLRPVIQCSIRPSTAIFNRGLHQSKPLYGIEEFFENGQSLPPFDNTTRRAFGRAWDPDELRLKSFEDLHKLWFVLLKELNLLSTQKAEANRMHQRWFNMHRVHKVWSLGTNRTFNLVSFIDGAYQDYFNRTEQDARQG